MRKPDANQRRSQIQAELRAPFLVLLLLVPLLALAGWKLDSSIVGAQLHQRGIRATQILRGRVLRFQLDEETGIRGFEATGDRQFLEPFAKAKRSMHDAIFSLKTEADRLGIPRVAMMMDDQKALNDKWLDIVAMPLVSGGRRTPSHALDVRGKQLIDAFRNRDQAIIIILNSAADAADKGSDRALEQLTMYLVLSSGAIAVGAGMFGLYRARSAREAFENALVLNNQKRIASSLQEAFANKALPALPGVALRGTYVAAEKEAQVGGDWYDAFQLPNGRILFSIGDVAGHGIEAAVVMSRARQAIIAAAIGESDPAKVLERANQAVLLQESKMVTAICGFVDPNTFEIVYSTAGHPAPILVRPGAGAHFLPQSGVPLGLFNNTNFQTYMTNASDGAVMFLYTDGLIEHKRDIVSGEKELLRESVRASQNLDDPSLELHRLVLSDGQAPDDVAILTIGFRRVAIADSGMPKLANLETLPSSTKP